MRALWSDRQICSHNVSQLLNVSGAFLRGWGSEWYRDRKTTVRPFRAPPSGFCGGFSCGFCRRFFGGTSGRFCSGFRSGFFGGFFHAGFLILLSTSPSSYKVQQSNSKLLLNPPLYFPIKLQGAAEQLQAAVRRKAALICNWGSPALPITKKRRTKGKITKPITFSLCNFHQTFNSPIKEGYGIILSPIGRSQCRQQDTWSE